MWILRSPKRNGSVTRLSRVWSWSWQNLLDHLLPDRTLALHIGENSKDQDPSASCSCTSPTMIKVDDGHGGHWMFCHVQVKSKSCKQLT